MKKIGLAVCYDTKNFGSQLQVIATIKRIEKMGYETEIIRYKKKLDVYFVLQNIPRLFNFYFINSKIKSLRKKRKLKSNPEVYNMICNRNKRFLKFAKNNFKKLSPYYKGWKKLREGASSNYSAVLCGSDQLWLPSNLESHFYTLEFADDTITKIAYATSFGVGQIPWYQKNRTKKYLSKFDYLSCREIQGTRIIKKLIKKDIPTVCDPTLLLSASEWNSIIKPKNIIKEDYIFCYFLGDNVMHRDIAKELALKYKYKIVTIPFLDNYVESDLNFGDYKMYDLDTCDFVNLIRNAKYVLTDSFHGTIFSLLYHKKFMIFNRFSDESKNSRNSRIDSLTTLLDIKDRRYKSNIIVSINNEINYNAVDKKINSLKLESEKYLNNALDKIRVVK